MAIIIDNKNEDVSGLVLSDDGTGAGISIPAFLINRKQGEYLKKFIIKNTRSKKGKEKDGEDEGDENDKDEDDY